MGSWQDLAGSKPGAVPPIQQAPGLPKVHPACEHQFQTRQPTRLQHFSAQAAGPATMSPPCSPLHFPKLPRSIGNDALELLHGATADTRRPSESWSWTSPAGVEYLAALCGASSILNRHPKSRLYTCRPLRGAAATCNARPRRAMATIEPRRDPDGALLVRTLASRAAQVRLTRGEFLFPVPRLRNTRNRNLQTRSANHSKKLVKMRKFIIASVPD